MENNGRKQGKNEGIAEEKLQIAKIMLKKKMLLEDIIEITRLSKAEIENLIQDYKENEQSFNQKLKVKTKIVKNINSNKEKLSKYILIYLNK